MGVCRGGALPLSAGRTTRGRSIAPSSGERVTPADSPDWLVDRGEEGQQRTSLRSACFSAIATRTRPSRVLKTRKDDRIDLLWFRSKTPGDLSEKKTSGRPGHGPSLRSCLPLTARAQPRDQGQTTSRPSRPQARWFDGRELSTGRGTPNLLDLLRACGGVLWCTACMTKIAADSLRLLSPRGGKPGR